MTAAPTALRPKDAATILVVRRDGLQPRVLMGRRSRGHAFMPDKWVFPGGRIDRADFRVPAASELRPEVAATLERGCGADAKALVSLEPGAGSGELGELAWFDWDAAGALDLPGITRAVLAEVRLRLDDRSRPVPFHRHLRGRHQLLEA